MSFAKNLKLSFFGLMSATLMSAPAFAQNAASVTQLSNQDATQVGVGNVAVQGNAQSATVTQSPTTYPYYPNHPGYPSHGYPSHGYPSHGYPSYPSYPSTGVNGAVILQGNDQDATQIGGFNSAIQGSAADATIQQR